MNNKIDVPALLERVHLDPSLKFCLAQFMGYASYKILENSIPHFFDGQLITHRRNLFAMQDVRALSSKKHQKSNFVTSHATGYYAPVGDTYGPLVTMACSYERQILLVDPEGNWGPIEKGKDGAAAVRYTEIRSSKFAEAVLFEDLPSSRVVCQDENGNINEAKHGVVPSRPTYNSKYYEEDYFPAKLPLLLINGSTGIAVGIAQDFPQINMDSLLTNFIHYLRTGGIIWESLKFGYPTECAIVSPQEKCIEALQSGKGSIKLAARYEWIKRGSKFMGVRVTHVPHQVSLNSIGDAFNAWAKEPECPFVSHKNLTTKKEINLEFYLKKSVYTTDEEKAEEYLGQLYNASKLIMHQTVNMNALKDRYPILYNVELFFSHWYEERNQIIKRISKIKKRKLEARIRVLNLQLIVKANSEATLKLLQEIESDETLVGALNEAYQGIPLFEESIVALTLDDIQNLMNFNLRTLSKANEQNITNTRDARIDELFEVEDLIQSEESRKAQIIDTFEHFMNHKEKYGIRDLECPFDENLGALLAQKKLKKSKPGMGDALNFDVLLQPSSSDDVLVQTEKGYFFRISTRSVKSTPLKLKKLLSEDRIVRADFIHHDTAFFLTGEGKLVALHRDLMEYNSAYNSAQILQLAKRRDTPGDLYHIATLHKKPDICLIQYGDGTLKRFALTEFATFRTKAKLHKKVLSVTFASSEDPWLLYLTEGGDLAYEQLNTERLHSIRQGTRLQKWHTLRRFVPVSRGAFISIISDGREIFKTTIDVEN